MKTKYELNSILSPELVGLYSEKYSFQLWSLSDLTKKHKDDKCGICNLSVGNEAYRPTTNKYNRGERICVKCIKELKKEKN